MATIDPVTTSGHVLGQVLTKLRAERGMKQSDLAAAAKVGPSTWSRIEKGESGLSIDQLRLVAKALDITPGLLLEMLEAAEKQVEDQGVRITPSTATWFSGADNSVSGAVAGIAAGVSLGTVVPIVGSALGGLIGGAIGHFLTKSEKGQKDK